MTSSRVLLAERFSERELRASLRDGRRIALGLGFSVNAETWRSWHPEEQHLARALAIAYRSYGSRAVFSQHTAALVHGFPSFNLRHEPVHLVQMTGKTHGRKPGVVRHHQIIDPTDVVVIDGLRCTGAVRTLYDMARLASPEQAIITLDSGLAALNRARSNGKAHTQELFDRIRAKASEGVRGIRQARLLCALADPRADSPAESLSRLQLTRLGFEVNTQVEIPGPRGTYLVDFEFVGLDVLGEVDGAVKYRDQEMLGEKTSWEVIREEKYREDWIRGVTGKRVVRWGFQEAANLSKMRSRLQAFGVNPASGWRSERRAHVFP